MFLQILLEKTKIEQIKLNKKQFSPRNEGWMNILLESLILAQDERWRRA